VAVEGSQEQAAKVVVQPGQASRDGAMLVATRGRRMALQEGASKLSNEGRGDGDGDDD